MRSLFTIGYEGMSIDGFLALVKEKHIERIIDVRRNPVSRKRGFSKTALSTVLQENGINYTHMIVLGTPQELRKTLKEDSDYDNFFIEVEDYIKEQTDALQTAMDLALSQTCALLCFERKPSECHRSVVAVEIVRQSNLELTVEHIGL